MDDGHIPNLETLSYGGAFATAQIPSLDASKITSGVFSYARIPWMNIPASGIQIGGTNLLYKDIVGNFVMNEDLKLDAGKYFALPNIPTMDDAHIPDLETLSYGGAFATAQIPNLDASKIVSGVFNQARIPWTSIPASGIVIGGDVNLYRSAANVLKTDDAFEVLGQLKLPTWPGVGILLGGDVNIYRAGVTAYLGVNMYGTMRAYLTNTGSLYIDGTYETFSPEFPKEWKDEDYKTYILDMISKPVKPKDLKVTRKNKKEVEEKYAKDIGGLTIATGKLVLNLLDRLKVLEAGHK